MSVAYPDPCPLTGRRRRITVAEWASRPESLVEEYAYLYDPCTKEFRLVQDASHVIGNLYDVDFTDDRYRSMLGDRKLYIRPEHWEILKCGK